MIEKELIKAAEAGNETAINKLIFVYKYGDGVEQNVELSIKWAKKAATLGNTEPIYEYAMAYYNGSKPVEENKSKAIEYFIFAANSGNIAAMRRLGISYASGDGVEKDDVEAVKWFEKGAKKGDQYSQKNLAIHYRNGKGVIQNKAKAEEWFLKSAEQGNVQAKSCLANMYFDGEGIEPNYVKAETLFKEVLESKEQDYYEPTLFRLALLYATKLNNEYAAFPLWRQLAELGNADAQYNVGLCYHNGLGTVVDKSQALIWWEKAAEQGNQNARNNVEMLRRESTKKSGHCYIATAVYGSYDCPEVWILRRYRDYRLAQTWYGRVFIKTYYTISPSIVKWFGGTEWFKHLWKRYLDGRIKNLQKEGYESTPYDDQTY